MDHLNALQLRLSNERQRLLASKSDSERKSRQVIVDGIEREIKSELEFLGLDQPVFDMTDDEIFAALYN